jgi:hypothetical protein
MKIRGKLSVLTVFRPRCESRTATVPCERSKSIILVKCNTVKRWRVTAGKKDGEVRGQGIFLSYDVAIRLRFVARQMEPACRLAERHYRAPVLSTSVSRQWHNNDSALWKTEGCTLFLNPYDEYNITDWTKLTQNVSFTVSFSATMTHTHIADHQTAHSLELCPVVPP